MTVNQAFGSVLRDVRRKRRITQLKMGPRVRISRQQFSYMENGHIGVTLEILVMIARELEVTPEELVRWTMTRLRDADRD